MYRFLKYTHLYELPGEVLESTTEKPSLCYKIQRLTDWTSLDEKCPVYSRDRKVFPLRSAPSSVASGSESCTFRAGDLNLNRL